MGVFIVDRLCHLSQSTIPVTKCCLNPPMPSQTQPWSGLPSTKQVGCSLAPGEVRFESKSVSHPWMEDPGQFRPLGPDEWAGVPARAA
jgi:hypothetical protein